MKTIIDKYFRMVKGIVPDNEAVSYVGLDIGLKSCKMVEIKEEGNTAQLTNWGIEPIVNGDKQKAVNSILSKLPTPTNFPRTSVCGKGTLIRYIEMPRMTLEDLRKSFALEADKYFPFPSNQIYTDCYILDPKGKENKMSVLVAAAKKEIVNERIDLLTALGLQSDFIGIDSIAIANALHIMGADETEEEQEVEDRSSSIKAMAVLDMGEVVSNITILEDGLPRFTRDIFIGGREFTRSIGNALGVDLEEAEQLKCSSGEKLSEVLNASDSAILNLVSELRLSFDYFITERNMPLSQVLLTGGASMLEGLPELFSKYLEMPVRRWDPLQKITIAPEIAVDEIKKNAAKLGVALGLALYK